MVSLEVMPWFSPAVSPEISRVMHNLGYRTEFWPGDEIGRRFFHRVVFMAVGVCCGCGNRSGAACAPFDDVGRGREFCRDGVGAFH